MKFTKKPNIVFKTFPLLTVVGILLAAVSAPAQTVVPVAPFRSIELRDGGHIFLRYGATQTVTLQTGNESCVQFIITGGDRLTIKKNKAVCPRKFELEIEITVPEIAELKVESGGIIQSRDAFPRQAQLKTAVSNGGIIDVRKIASSNIIASIEEGGAIYITPEAALTASIFQGGLITYWGNPRVASSVRDGGAVKKGKAEEADQPLAKSSNVMNSTLSPLIGISNISTKN